MPRQAVLRRVRGVQDISVELTDIQEAAKVAAMAGSRWTTIFKRQYRAELTMVRAGLCKAAPGFHLKPPLPWRTASVEDSMRYGFGLDFSSGRHEDFERTSCAFACLPACSVVFAVQPGVGHAATWSCPCRKSNI